LLGEDLVLNSEAPEPARAESDATGSLDTINTVKEVAAFLKVSPRTIVRAVAEGELKAYRIRTVVRIGGDAVWAWLEAATAPDAAEADNGRDVAHEKT
jgi:excisionase family DNA binding protein